MLCYIPAFRQLVALTLVLLLPASCLVFLSRHFQANSNSPLSTGGSVKFLTLTDFHVIIVSLWSVCVFCNYTTLCSVPCQHSVLSRISPLLVISFPLVHSLATRTLNCLGVSWLAPSLVSDTFYPNGFFQVFMPRRFVKVLPLLNLLIGQLLVLQPCFGPGYKLLLASKFISLLQLLPSLSEGCYCQLGVVHTVTGFFF